jgi:hypothetical protein
MHYERGLDRTAPARRRIAIFATAYFHRPDEFQDEILKAGFFLKGLLGLEGPFWLLKEFDDIWSTHEGRTHILRLAKKLGGEPSLLGASAHLLASPGT